MAQEAPLYLSRESVPNAVGNAQSLSGGNAGFEAAARFGQALTSFAVQRQAAQTRTDYNRTMTDYLRGAQEIEDRYERDPEYRGQEGRAAEDLKALRGSVLANRSFDRQTQSQLDLSMQRVELSSKASVRRRAFAKEASDNVAQLNAQEPLYLQRLAKAGSETERAAIHQEREGAMARAVQAGWITAAAAQQRNSAFRESAQQADVMQAIRERPAEALKVLADPKRFPDLDPVRRQTLINQAQAANDTRTGLEIANMAKSDPARAIATLGRVPDLKHIPLILERALIPQESGGNPNAQSNKGAAGIAQFMPGTARMVAKQAGIADLNGLDDAAINAKLKSDPALSRRLAVFHMGDLARKFDGRLAPVFAAYHAGEGRAMAFHKQAIEKFGAAYTPAQYVSLIPDSLHDGANGRQGKKTSDYVRDLFARLGAPQMQSGLSPNAWYRTTDAVGSEFDSQARERRTLLANMAAAGRAGDDVAGLLNEGYALDPGRLAQYKLTQQQAALAGDSSSAKELRKVETAERLAPLVRQAYQMNPGDLERMVTREEARLRTSPDVSAFERDRFDAAKAVFEEVKKRRGENPVALLERAGAITPVRVPVDADMSSPEFMQALAARDRQAVMAQQRYGGSLKPLSPEEASALSKRWADSANNSEARLSMIRAFSDNMDEAGFRAAMAQIGAGDKSVETAAMVMRSAPDVAAKIIRGTSILALPGVKPKADEIRPALKAVFGGAVYPPAVQQQLGEAALAVYAAERGANATLWDTADRNGLQSAIEAVAGKMVRINGRMTPLPRGMNEGEFSREWAQLSKADLEPFGGSTIAPDVIARYARLEPMGVANGKYLVTMQGVSGQVPVMTPDQRPLVVDLPAMIEARKREGRWLPETDTAARRINRARRLVQEPGGIE